MAIPISQRIPNNQQELYRQMFDAYGRQLRVAEPGIIEAFDATTQTVTVQLAIRERVQNPDTLEYKWTAIPLLVDVPIMFPRAGGFVLTMPVQKGDECLVIFSDMCEDGWFQHGSVQNQAEIRRHDLSDGFCILGPWSQPNVIASYSTDSAQLRTEDGATYISLKSGEIDLHATSVKINGLNFGSHVHSDPQGGTTGTPQ